MNKKCPFCGSGEMHEMIIPGIKHGMYSDSSICCVENFGKIVCEKCGCAFMQKSKANLDFYKREYTYNVRPGEEHYFKVNGKYISRTEVIFDAFISGFIPDNPHQKILEIGCGKGSLLKRIGEQYQNVSLQGIELSEDAAIKGREKGLDVIQSSFNDYCMLNPESPDIIISFGVLEHVADPQEFLNNAFQILADDGLFISVLPDPSVNSYDIFFLDHLSHISPQMLCHLVEKAGFTIDTMRLDHAVLYNFQGIYARKLAGKLNEDGFSGNLHNRVSVIEDTFTQYLSVFNYLNSKLSGHGPVAVFGGGEMLSLLYAYSNLGKDDKIMKIIDDKPKANSYLNIPIMQTDNVDFSKINCSTIVVATAPSYYNDIASRLIQKGFGGELIFPCENIL